MKVKELIEGLQQLDPDKEIVIGVIDSEYGDLKSDIETILLQKDIISEEEQYVICDLDYMEDE
ncbi:hypothetical protein JJB71_13405 [Clostridium perfringens]|uniref:hypothetical protein n=1 Tax=Clostridium perfringens TaxID=1502 RepID=UPI001ABBC57C|nr:hypothetical protein [Clostridium perfringens]MBO3398536.1 hypothetical protein [Clostridium perfringens]